MKQVVDVWGSVVGTKNAVVKNLFLRGQALVWRQQIGGRRVTRAVPVRRLRQGEALGRDLVKQAVEWMKRAEGLAVDDARGWDAIEGTKARRDDALFADVFAAFEAGARRRGEPREKSVRGYIWALRKVVQVADGLKKVEEVDKLRVSILEGLKGGDLVARYVEGVKAERGVGASTLRSIKSTVNQARQVFQSGFLEEYAKLRLPDLSGFMNRFTVKADGVARVGFSAEQVRILESGRELRDAEDAALRSLYPFWFLGFHCALRPGESVQVRASWVKEYVVTGADRAEWMGDRKSVWILDCGSDPDTRLKNAVSAGVVPLADDVAAELRRICADGREFVVPGKSMTARVGVQKAFARWLVGQGWSANKGQKKGHDLRAVRFQIWTGSFDQERAHVWARHEVKGVAKNYLGRVPMGLVLARPPMGIVP